MGLPPPGDEADQFHAAAPQANGAAERSSSGPAPYNPRETSHMKQTVLQAGAPASFGSPPRASNLVNAHGSSPSSAVSNLHHEFLAVDDLKKEKSGRSVNTQIKFANNSIFARIAYNPHFQNFTLLIVVVNALWIGIDTQWNHKNSADDDGKTPLQPFSDVVEHSFCGYFTLDVVVRFLAFRHKCSCWRDGWFVFDAILVAFMVIETWILLIVQEAMGTDGGSDFMANFSVLRLLRLARLTRMARLMRQVPELVTLCKGVISATKAVCWILAFLVAVMYVFGIVMCGFIPNDTSPLEVVGEDGEIEELDATAGHLFGTLGDAMMSLFTLGTLADNMAQTWDALRVWKQDTVECYAMQWTYFTFFCISSLTLLNMLIGVLCEVITQTSESENDGRMENELRWCIEDAFGEMDLNQDDKISEEEWSKIKFNPALRDTLYKLGVDEDYQEYRLDQMQEILFHEQFGTICQVRSSPNEKGIKMEHLISKVVEIRPDKEASALNVEMLGSVIRLQDRKNQKRLKAIQESVAQICRVRGIDPTLTPRRSMVTMTPFGSEFTDKGSMDTGPPGHLHPSDAGHLRPNRPGETPQNPASGAKWAHPKEKRHSGKNSQKPIRVEEAEPVLTSVMPVTSAMPVTPASDLSKVLNTPPSPPGDPTQLIRYATSGSSPNLRNMPIEQLVEVLKRRDPSLLKGLPQIGVGDTSSSASQRNDRWVAQQCPELHVEPSREVN